MKLSKVIATFGLIFSAAPLWAQKNVPANLSLDRLIGEMKSSTDSMRVQSLGQMLSEYQPKTEENVKSLTEAMQDNRIAPYVQEAISKAKDPALGPTLYEGLKSFKTTLKHVPPKEFKKLGREQQGQLMAQVMNIAAVSHALGNIKYRPAAPALRELLDYDDEFEGYLSWEASRALGEMGDEQALQMLSEKLGKNKPISISGYGARGIRKTLAKIEAVDATFKSNSEKIGDPRRAQIVQLAQEIGRIRNKDNDTKEALRQLLHHKYRRVAWEASDALVFCLSPRDKDISSEMLKSTDSYIRMSGLESLRMSHTWDKSFLPIIIEILRNDPDESVRVKAALELMSLMEFVPRGELQEAVPHLKAALKDPSLSVRLEAFLALRPLTGKFFPYEGMDESMKKHMERGPVDLYSK